MTDKTAQTIAAAITKGMIAQSDSRSLDGVAIAPKRYTGRFDDFIRASQADVDAGRVTLFNWHGEIEVQRLAKYVARYLESEAAKP